MQLLERESQMIGVSASYSDGATGRGTRHEESSRFDTIPHRHVRSGMKLGNAMYHDVRSTRVLDIRPHRDEEVGKVHDLGLTGGIVNDRRAARANGSHHEILRRAHTLKVQDDLGAN